MADVIISKKLLLFFGLLLVLPLVVCPFETGGLKSGRRLLKHSQPPKTTMATTIAATGATTHAEFHAAAHEVPSGPNPESNSRKIGGVYLMENKVMGTWHGQQIFIKCDISFLVS
ncbi:hypothetical protein LXL04_014550 [Taraxacum kok-saghyz]